MRIREQSINKLRNAVKNKTLGAYNGARHCVYYDKTTDSCCAIGELYPRKKLLAKNAGESVIFCENEDFCAGIADQLQSRKGKFGFTIDELEAIQRAHDRCVIYPDDRAEYLKYFEELIFSLK